MATSVVFPRVQFFANNGRPLIGGRIHTYVAGSSTRARTYKDAAKAQPNANPIILDARGEASVYLAEGVEYKFVIEDSQGALIMTQEPVYGAVWPNAAEWPSDATLSYQYMTEAKAAVDSMGITRAPFDTYAQAVGALPSLTNGERIEVSSDETRLGARTRYKVEGGALVFVVNLDQVRLDLAEASGAGTVGYLPEGVGAVATNVQAKLRKFVSVKDFGAVGDGVADDTAAFNLSFAALGSAGGVVTVPNSMRCLIDSNLMVPANVSLVGPHEYVGSPGRNNSTPFGSMGGVLIVNSAATLTVGSNASISGFFIYRKGMTFPTVNASAFSGTAITIDGDDSAVTHCLVIGFNKAVYSSGDQRQRINNLWFDCVNGIEITNCLDTPHIHNCHGWPFATIEASTAGTPGASIIRAGIAYYLHDTVDWAKLTDCFSYGYLKGFKLTSANSCTLLSCGADNITSGGAPAYPGSIGFDVGGQENRLIGCQAAAQTIGVSVASNDGVMQTIVGLNIWACGDHGVLVSGGDLSISASNFRSVNSGITVANSISKVLDGGGNRFESILGSEWAVNVATNTSKIKIAPTLSSKSAGAKLAGSNLVLETIASADPISPSINGDLFIVSGTTSFGGMNGGWAGRIVTLVFSGALSIFSSAGSATAIRLSSGATYTSAENSTITLLYTGSQWVEIGRSA